MNSDISDLEAPPAPPPTPPNRGNITTIVTPTVSNLIYIPSAMMTRSTSSASSVATTAAYHNNNCNKMNTALLSSSTNSASLDAASAAVTISNEFKLNNELNSSSKLFNERKPQERYVWEMRTRSPNVTPASTVLNSPDLSTDVQYAMHQHNRQHSHQHHPHHQIRLGRSPVSQFEQHNMLPQVSYILNVKFLKKLNRSSEKIYKSKYYWHEIQPMNYCLQFLRVRLKSSICDGSKTHIN